MAGHSKSSNIKHRKNAQDAKRSRLFTKLAREIMVAARENPDASQNFRLRLAKERALAANLKKETIEKAIKKVTEPSSVSMEAIRYEGYGPSGIPMLVDVFTDNRKRTVSDLRYVFNRQGGSLGTTGSVAWLFHRKGLIQLAKGAFTEDQLTLLALEVDAEDILFSPSATFSPKLILEQAVLESAVRKLEANSILLVQAIPTWLAVSRTAVEDKILLGKIQELIRMIEELPDVEAVYASCSWQLE